MYVFVILRLKKCVFYIFSLAYAQLFMGDNVRKFSLFRIQWYLDIHGFSQLNKGLFIARAIFLKI